MKFSNCLQGSSEWFQIRAGKVTASEVDAALSFLSRKTKNAEKGEESAVRYNYKVELIGEILSGAPDMEGYLSQAMKDGRDFEPIARSAYEVRADVLVDQLGFIYHPTIERAGASPDGLVGADGYLEIKCPKTKTHIGYMLAGILPPEYEPQVMFGLACSERKWCDFVSFDGRLPSRHQLFVKRVYRDEARISEINAGVIQFLSEVDALIAKMDELNPAVEPERKVVEIDPETMITDADMPDWMKQHLNKE